MAPSKLLTFCAFPEKVRLDGFDARLLQGLQALFVRVREAGFEEASYRVSTHIVTGEAVRSAEVATIRRPAVRFVPGTDEDLVLMAAGRVRLAPARPSAVLEMRPIGGGISAYAASVLTEAAFTHALALRGRAVLHAAALEIGGTSILAAGSTRSGKSTLAAAVLRAGGGVVSDDSVVLGTEDREAVMAGALRRDLWFRKGTVDLLPDKLRSRLREGSSFGERRWGLERQSSRSCFREFVHPDVVILLRRDARMRAMRITRVRAAEALAGLIRATSPLFLSGRYPVERERLLPVLTSLANGTPCFAVRMGRSLLENPEHTVGELLGNIVAG
ncbi:MAG: hypothetical protein P8Y93_13575 [Acidobacteriota bacterium]